VRAPRHRRHRHAAQGQGRSAPETLGHDQAIYRILADDVGTVTAWLAERVLANTRHGAKIAWLTGAGAAGRFLKALVVKPTPIPALEAA
jgi:hypothetical protein